VRSALIVLFNQDFTKNVPKLEALYGGRFTEIRYIAPDHWSRLDRPYLAGGAKGCLAYQADCLVSGVRRVLGKRNPFELAEGDAVLRQRILRVVGHQFQFYHFVVQAAKSLLKLEVDWFWVIGDDAILNPRLDERGLAARFALSAETDAVLCRPVYGFDAWIEHICGSIDSGLQRAARALGRDGPWVREPVQPEPGAERNDRLPVACMDFFGLSRTALQRLLPIWERMFRQRLYVELGGPLAILATFDRIRFCDDFDWCRNANKQEMEAILDALAESETLIFSHPIKLSMFKPAQVERLRPYQ